MPDYSFPVKKSVYPPDVLLKAAYNFIDRVYIHFEETATDWLVYVCPKEADYAPDLVQRQFENELISQTVRLNVYQKTHSLRDLLMARAMTTSMIDEEDPVERAGADPCDISNAELHDILTDWFEKYEK